MTYMEFYYRLEETKKFLFYGNLYPVQVEYTDAKMISQGVEGKGFYFNDGAKILCFRPVHVQDKNIKNVDLLFYLIDWDTKKIVDVNECSEKHFV